MHKGSSQITSGHIVPSLSGPRKDKDVFVVSGLVVGLAVVIGGIWYYSSTEQSSVPDQLNGVQVSEALNKTQPAPTPVLFTADRGESLSVPTTPGIFHIDLYFELGRKGLTDEAKKTLQARASTLKQDPNLGVLVQGFTDQQGSASYNMTLGMKRAETVKAELINAGVAEHQIKTVSLGKDGVLCIDMSDVCRQMNRRVHLEIRPIGEEHMKAPVIAASPAPEPAAADPAVGEEFHGTVMDDLLPSANASEANMERPALEPPSGS